MFVADRQAQSPQAPMVIMGGGGMGGGGRSERWIFLAVIAIATIALTVLVLYFAKEKFVSGDATPPVFPPEDGVESFQSCYLNGSGSIGENTGGGVASAERSAKAVIGNRDAPVRTAGPNAVAAPPPPPKDYESPYANIPPVVDAMMETPGAAPTGEWRPCEVYFTDHMKLCDTNQFRYHPVYYETKLADVRKAVAERGGTPTAAQNDLIIRYTRILEDYKKFPQNQHCKLSLPNWKVRVDEPDTPFISKNLHNAERGTPSDWAFCWRPNPDPAQLRATGMIVEESGGRLQGNTFDGVFHVRGTFDENISRDGAVQTYCAETADRVSEYAIKSAIVIEDAPGARQTRFYKNDAPVEPTQDDVNFYFRDQLFRMLMSEVRSGNQRVGRVYAAPQIRSYRLVKLMKDPCDRTVEHYSTTATLEFGSDIELASTVLDQGNDYLHGLIPTLETRIGEHDALIQRLGEIIDDLIKQRDAKRKRLSQLSDDLKAAIKARDQARKKLEECKRNPYEKIAGLWRRVDLVGMLTKLYVYVDGKTGVAYTRKEKYGPNREILGQFLLAPDNRNEMTMRLKYVSGKYFTKSVDFYLGGKLLTATVNPAISMARTTEIPDTAGAKTIQQFLRTRGSRISFGAVR